MARYEPDNMNSQRHSDDRPGSRHRHTWVEENRQNNRNRSRDDWNLEDGYENQNYGGQREQERQRDYGQGGGYQNAGRFSGEDQYAREGRFGDRNNGYRSHQNYGEDYEQRGWDNQSDRNSSGRGYSSDGSGRQPHGQGSRSDGYRGSEDRGWGERAADEVKSWFGDGDAERRRDQDHRGRGPRNYQRSDTRIEEDINDRLSDDRYLDASDIEVSVADREVTLAGTVTSKIAKRRAEDCAESVSGVSHVQNNLRVSDGKSSAASDTTDTLV
jgi:osmotically-inducible protein OsmY